MQNYYLKAVDQAALRAALIAGAIVVVTEDGDQLAAGCALDIIGEIVKPTGNMITVDGAEVPEMAAILGYHANLLADLSDEQCTALADVLLPSAPANPYRVWAEMPPDVEQAEEIPVEVFIDEVQP